MNLDELRTVQMKERKKDSLQHLRDSFYADVAEYIEDLKADRSAAAERADDPFSSPEVGRLTDEIETAEEVAEAVYERRVGKVVKLASFAAAEMAVDEDGMTDEERRLFDDLVARIEQNKTTVLDTLAGKRTGERGDEAPAGTGGAPTPTADPDAAVETATGEPTDAGSSGVLAEAMGGADEATEAGESATESTSETPAEEASDGRPVPPDEPPLDDGAGASAAAGSETGPGTESGAAAGDTPEAGGPGDEPSDGRARDRSAGSEPEQVAPAATPGAGGADAAAGDDTERTTVRITRDVGAIFGVDEREYDLSSEDVVTLPTANAEPLLQRDAAERID
jgi:DNA replication factor GINS